MIATGENVMQFIAHGYCDINRFEFVPREGISFEASCPKPGNEILCIHAGSVTITAAREAWMREADYDEIHYAYFEMHAWVGGEMVFTCHATEFVVSYDSGTLAIGTRNVRSSDVSELRSIFGNRTEVHLIDGRGLYRRLKPRECERCDTRVENKIPLHGCTTCISRHMEERSQKEIAL